MSIDAILRLERTILFELLVAKEKLAGLDHEISERVRAVIAHVAPLMQRIPDKMPEYTLHDPNHGAKVVELMVLIIPKSTLNILNTIELSILIFAGYLHDLGMTCSTAEREQIIRSDVKFAQLLASDLRRSEQIEAFRLASDYRSATHIEDQVFTEYLRQHHVKRSAQFIETELANGPLEIAWKGTPYWRWVLSVCDSHALPVRDLRDTLRWPRDALVRNVRVNVQYLALVLRLGDILDLDPERTPQVLLDFINPTDPISIIEWNKHRSVIGWEITPERIQFEAECTDAVYERALREFIGWIEIERRDSVALASSYRDEIASAYHLDLTDPVTPERIRSNGTYIFSTLHFDVDHERVINLLMGERLYRNPAVALRELIQNSFDAVRYREALEKREGVEFSPKISITLKGDQLSVEDNGIGMDAEIVKKFFMQVGRSYYTSPQFRSQALALDIVSEFGIGILSAFMVANRLTVESRRRPENPFSPPESILVEIPTAHRYFVQRPSSRIKIGTKIDLTLKDGHPFSGNSIEELISQMVPFGEYPIAIQIEDERFFYAAHNVHNVRPRSAANWTAHLKIAVDSSVDASLVGVAGEINIIGSQTARMFDSADQSIIAQCGFAVLALDREHSDRNPASEFFPEWTQFAANLDVRPPARLALTPDRANVVRDEQFFKIKSALDRLAVNRIREHLAERMAALTDEEYADYIDELIEQRTLKAETYIGFAISLEACNLFLDYIPFKCIGANGMVTRILGRVLAANDVIVFADPRGWLTNIDANVVRREVDSHFGNIYPIVVDHNVGDFHRQSMYRHLFSNINGHLILSTTGVVLDLIERNVNAPDDSHVQGVAKVTFGLQSSGHKELPAIFHDRSSDSIHFEYPVLNVNHPFFAPLLNAPSSGAGGKADHQVVITLHGRVVGLLMGSIADAYYSTREGKAKNRHNRGRQVRDSILTEAPNRVLTGILKRDAGLLPAIRLAFIDYWQTAVEEGSISPDKAMPAFTSLDLPWYWSVDE
ncbi:MAG TPA: ATP-binding protein [Telluria sp.]|jgi:hypothetical protein